MQPPAADKTNPGAGIDYGLFLDCVHCGLCTASCPTYAEDGNENDSPRGRIYLMRAVTDGRLEMNHQVKRHLELCLDCRACESACPSGVQYGKLIEPFRVAMEEQSTDDRKSEDWFHRLILFGLFPYPERMRKSLWPARIAQRLGLDRLVLNSPLRRLIPSRLQRLMSLLPPLKKDPGPLPRVLPAIGKPRARVAMFTGCVADVMFRQTHWATARVLQENGCDVIVPDSQVCCGAIHYHAGASDPARELADQNLQAFDLDDVDAVLVNVAGCGSMLKDYGHHWPDARQAERERFAGKVRDVSEFLDELGLIPPQGELNITATYHDACHLAHAQQVRDQPRRLLKQIPGLKLKELPESEICCGAAGTYNLTEPDMADRLARRKWENIKKTGARVVVTANAGCLLQIARESRNQGEPLAIVHPMDLLDLSYRRQPLN
ncbi:(Fe-S)-binding protein [Lignipirellula cremea]|uniref:Glycolate oxidase iron-sulfur subunit n=1 Tax=Lignipirellula cremea TaxID=2528010 RepID=A0A518E0K5_9BACT|nr:(Fe-S)-binding protein [Lignipirellula cremea]QDU97624.1 Lactate utilization protein A [Lignipirellula cremea]